MWKMFTLDLNDQQSMHNTCVLNNVLQEWYAYIRTMVQFHVLGEMFYSSGHFDTKLYGMLPWADINKNFNIFLCL